MSIKKGLYLLVPRCLKQFGGNWKAVSPSILLKYQKTNLALAILSRYLSFWLVPYGDLVTVALLYSSSCFVDVKGFWDPLWVNSEGSILVIAKS